MTEKGTKTLIGFFVLCALALLAGGVMIVGSGSLSSSARFVCFFDASLRGLLPGSPVYFRGVRVGKVVSIQINADAEELAFRTPVVFELEKSTFKSSHADLASLLSRGSVDDFLLTELVRKGLRARLGTLSFVTGQLSVDLDMLPDAPPPTPEQMRPYDGIVQIPTVPSSLDEVINLVTDVPIRDITGETLLALRGINAQLNGLNLPELTASLTELSRQTTELVRELTVQARGLTDVRERAIATLERYGELAASMEKGTKDVSAMGVSARLTMESLQRLVQEDSAPLVEFSQTMRALRDAANSIDNLATLLELKPDALIFGRRP